MPAAAPPTDAPSLAPPPGATAEVGSLGSGLLPGEHAFSLGFAGAASTHDTAPLSAVTAALPLSAVTAPSSSATTTSITDAASTGCASRAPASAAAIGATSNAASGAALTEVSGAPKIRGAKAASAFYSQARRKEVRSANPTLDTSAINRLLQEAWKTASPETRQPFLAMAAEDRRRHERETAAAALPSGTAPAPSTAINPMAPMLD